MRVEQKAETLGELLQERAQRGPHDLAYGFLPEGEGDAVPITYGELDTEARRIAAQLGELLAPGSRALLVYEPGLQFIAAFFGCLYAGIVAVPVYPPMPGRLEAGLANLRLIAADCTAKAVLTGDQLRSFLQDATAAAPLTGIRWIVTGQGGGDVSAWRPPRIRAETPALLQYTSGSTTDPRGVMLRHENILANQRAIATSLRITSCIGLSWLPPYHDMGLFGFVVQPLYLGSPCYLMSALHFLQRPGRWLSAISRFRATHSGGPPFGYELCARRVTEAEKESLDLSSWQVAFVGAEPIRSEGLARFAGAFASCGFRKTSLYPCYGLAEATLLVTGSVPGFPPVREEVDPQALEKGVAQSPHTAGEEPKELVSSGRVPDGHQVVIVDRSATLPVAERTVGEVWVAGPSVADGYWNKPGLSAETFGATLPGFPGRRFLRTGDLGFLADGELFITGRIKEFMNVRGRNILPQDVEAIGQAADGRLRAGCGAAFALGDDDERVALVQETTATDPQQAAELLPRIRQAVQERLGVVLCTIVLVPAHVVPKTSSGKVRRLHTRELLSAGRLPLIASFGDQARDDAPPGSPETESSGDRS
jgi:acyl-CoA synthetase (AMP-forming)/AMP-acid ligase II